MFFDFNYMFFKLFLSFLMSLLCLKLSLILFFQLIMDKIHIRMKSLFFKVMKLFHHFKFTFILICEGFFLLIMSLDCFPLLDLKTC